MQLDTLCKLLCLLPRIWRLSAIRVLPLYYNFGWYIHVWQCPLFRYSECPFIESTVHVYMYNRITFKGGDIPVSSTNGLITVFMVYCLMNFCLHTARSWIAFSLERKFGVVKKYWRLFLVCLCELKNWVYAYLICASFYLILVDYTLPHRRNTTEVVMTMDLWKVGGPSTLHHRRNLIIHLRHLKRDHALPVVYFWVRINCTMYTVYVCIPQQKFLHRLTRLEESPEVVHTQHLPSPPSDVCSHDHTNPFLYLISP